MNHLIGIIFLFLSPLVLSFYAAFALYKIIRMPETILLDSYDMEALRREGLLKR